MPHKNREKQRKYISNWGKNNRDKTSKYKRDYLRKLRLEILHLAGETRCKRCGFSDFRALQIDHVNFVGYKNRLKQHQLKKDIIKNSQKYQVLCANCNWIKRYENNETNNKYIK